MIKVIIAVIVVGIVFVLMENARELSRFKTVHYQIVSPKLSGLHGEKKLIHLSDLHDKCYGTDNEPLLRAIRKEQPDLILISGDMLVGVVGGTYQNAVKLMEKLTKIAPVYYTNGNHEQRLKERTAKYGDVYAGYKKSLESADVTFLENERAELMLDDCKVTLYGLEIPLKCYERFEENPLGVQCIKECIGAPDSESYNILLAHNPMYFEDYKEWGADLVLAGHLHGGVIRIPGIGGLISPQAALIPKYSGELTKEDGSYMSLSKGLGTHTVNLRMFNPAELIVLHLRAE